MTSKVGIIANPASGKDIRRLVSHASVFDNIEKVNIVRRLILGLASTGVDCIFIMPDYFSIGRKALEGIKDLIANVNVSIIDMPISDSQEDSTRAANFMKKVGVSCIITIGGDGTNRAVAKGCDDIPILPISTGTNNVIPHMIEGTTAGLAGGAIAKNIINKKSLMKTKRLEILRNHELVDIALVDAVTIDNLFIGTKAIWDITQVRQIVATMGGPFDIGIASIVGRIHPLKADDPHGLYIRVGGEPKIKTPLAPGLVVEVGIKECQVINLGDVIEVENSPSVIALDGERELNVYSEDKLFIRLSGNGPVIVNVEETLKEAVRRNFFDI